MGDELRKLPSGQLDSFASGGVPRTAEGMVDFATGTTSAAAGTREAYDREQALKSWFANSRTEPADFQAMVRALPPSEQAEMRQLFETHKPSLGSAGYWGRRGDSALHDFAEWAKTNPGGRIDPNDNSAVTRLRRSQNNVVEHLPSATGATLDNIATELNTLSSSGNKPLVGETSQQTFQRLHPVTADVQAQLGRTGDRWGSALLHGDWSRVKNDYYKDPVGTFLEDAAAPLAATPLGRVFRKGGEALATSAARLRPGRPLGREPEDPAQLAATNAGNRIDHHMTGNRNLATVNQLSTDLGLTRQQIRAGTAATPGLHYTETPGHPELDTVRSDTGRLPALGTMHHDEGSSSDEITNEPGARAHPLEDPSSNGTSTPPYAGNPSFRSSPGDRSAFRANYPQHEVQAEAIRKITADRPDYRDIPEEDLVSLRAYTARGYWREMNEALRSQDVAKISVYEDRIRTATSALNQMPKYTGLTRRGIQINDGATLDSMLSKYKVGKIVTENQFISSSSAAERAGGFKGNVRFEIQSKNGRYIAPISTFPDQAEVVFPPGSRFKIAGKSFDDVSNAWHVKMSEVDTIR